MNELYIFFSHDILSFSQKSVYIVLKENRVTRNWLKFIFSIVLFFNQRLVISAQDCSTNFFLMLPLKYHPRPPFSR